MRAAGKIRHYGAALGSMADGLKAIRENDIASLMTTFNCLDQEPAKELLAGGAGPRGSVCSRAFRWHRVSLRGR